MLNHLLVIKPRTQKAPHGPYGAVREDRGLRQGLRLAKACARCVSRDLFIHTRNVKVNPFLQTGPHPGLKNTNKNTQV